ncbi:MAG: ECF transporter S component [Spirochaetaceae bacterium]|nr:ECF transporter S component [Spirochaetaceae bacterium]
MAQGSSPVRKAVVAGALGAVSIALFLTPFGYIPWIAGASLTVMHVPAILGAVLEGPVVGMIVGAIFGVTSLVKAATAPQGPIDVFFTNPLVSILPRVAVGLVAWLVYRAFRGKLSGLAAAVAGALGSLANSVLVLGFLVLFGALPLAVAASVFVANGLVEAAAAAILTLGVVAAWRGVGGKGKAKLADEDK